MGGAGGYLLGGKSSANQVTNTVVQPTQTIPNSQSMDKFSNITYLMKYRDAGPVKEKTIFITKDKSGESFEIADIKMSDSSIKQLYKLDFPSAIGFNPPIFIVNNYMIVPVAGADANDILIFTLTGKIVPGSLVKLGKVQQ